MKKVLFLAAWALVWGAGLSTAGAQNADGKADREARRAVMQQRRTERLMKVLELKDSEKEAFLTTYRAYQKELESGMPALAPQKPLRQEDANRKEQKLTDEEATRSLQTHFERQAQRIERMKHQLEVQKKYYAEFAKTLTPAQMLKIFTPQGENAPRHVAGGNRNGGRQPFGGGHRAGGFGGGFGAAEGGSAGME